MARREGEREKESEERGNRGQEAKRNTVSGRGSTDKKGEIKRAEKDKKKIELLQMHENPSESNRFSSIPKRNNKIKALIRKM